MRLCLLLVDSVDMDGGGEHGDGLFVVVGYFNVVDGVEEDDLGKMKERAVFHCRRLSSTSASVELFLMHFMLSMTHILVAKRLFF